VLPDSKILTKIEFLHTYLHATKVLFWEIPNYLSFEVSFFCVIKPKSQPHIRQPSCIPCSSLAFFLSIIHYVLPLKQTHYFVQKIGEKVKVKFQYLVYGRLNNSYGRSSIIIVIVIITLSLQSAFLMNTLMQFSLFLLFLH
jgi:hypothetical protein